MTTTETEIKTLVYITPEAPQEPENMKNSKEYGIKMDKFFRSIRSGQKVKPADFADAIDALIYGLISESITERHAKKVFKNLQSHFIDHNDLRVSRIEEVQDILEETTPRSEQIARALTRMLSAVLDKYDALSLKTLGEQGKR